MVDLVQTIEIQCPYCWELFETTIDSSGIDPNLNEQQYTEDCYVCCRPIVIYSYLDEAEAIQVSVEAELN